MLATDVGWRGCWKHPVAAVDPGQRKRQWLKHLYQGMAHMAATEQCNGMAHCLQNSCQLRAVIGADDTKHQIHNAAAALAKGRPQCKAFAMEGQYRISCGQLGTGVGNGYMLEVTATYRADQFIRENRHPGCGLTRHRALGGFDLHQHSWLVSQQAKKALQRRGVGSKGRISYALGRVHAAVYGSSYCADGYKNSEQ